MSDQAENLRRKLEARHVTTKAGVISILNAESTEKRTDIAADFAMELSLTGSEVLIIGRGRERRTSSGILSEEAAIHTASGVYKEAPYQVETTSFPYSFPDFEKMLFKHDYIFLDLGSGILREEAGLAACADETFIIMENSDVSLKKAYAMIKKLHSASREQRISLLPNRISDERNDRKALERVKKVTADFLGKEVNLPVPLPGTGGSQSVFSASVNELKKERRTGDSFLIRLKKLMAEI
ncbi:MULTISPECIES: P-loop NTPase family protein [Salimicrobium]|uniref:Flagellar synthesis regulator fleN n=2 Tax=Salimicrobium TaxID=351195 RepID=K2GEX2_9BACI|nr:MULTISPECIES: flagellar synthesis regulator FleN [Salimicrobium]AKG04558.1 hypothetical protein AAV35_006975 [Salimicrobium jeotgali]EKE32772.1 flagellar synthesis regulator fleN [Salimicrobium jeotgali]MBM7695240.1 flagellar biosynthesis protein FlhG [Salimicrobium jeotgali]SDX30684.1 hypothetical protein SAMN04488081_0113 [Salimicrobium album]